VNALRFTKEAILSSSIQNSKAITIILLAIGIA
jgi:hypothetical protein